MLLFHLDFNYFLITVASGLLCMAEISSHPERLLRQSMDLSLQVRLSNISCLTHPIILK